MSAPALNRPGGMPPPIVEPVNEGLWRAAAEGRLDVQRCTACGVHRNPPTDGCRRCGSLTWEWDTLPGTGVIATYVWMPDSTRSGGDDAALFYNVVVIDLDGVHGGPVRIVSNVVDAWNLDDLEVGLRVTLRCVPLGDGLGLPCFRRDQ